MNGSMVIGNIRGSTIRAECDLVRTPDAEANGVHNRVGGRVNDRDRAVTVIGNPHLRAIRSDSKRPGVIPGGNVCSRGQTGSDINREDVASVVVGNVSRSAVRGECHSLGARSFSYRGGHPTCRAVDDRDGSVVVVGDIRLTTVGRECHTLRGASHGDGAGHAVGHRRREAEPGTKEYDSGNRGQGKRTRD
jgi:hypothetical protein